MATLSVRNVVCCVTISFCCLSFENMHMPLCKDGVVMPVQSDGEACQRTSKQHKAAFADPGHRERPKQADQATETQPRPAPEARSGLWPHKGQRRPSKLLSGHSFRLSVRQPWQELLETRPRHCFSHKMFSESKFWVCIP